MFFILMLAAKGLGLDSGDKLYYVLSGAAFICVAVKLCLTQCNKKELTVLTGLCLLAVLAYINSGRLGIVLSILAIIGMKDMDIKKLFRLGLTVYGITFTITIISAALGIIPNAFVVHAKGSLGEVIRWGMGFSTGNVFHESYFILVVLIVYNMEKKYGIKQFLWLMAGNLLVFVFTFSYTGISVTAFYLILNLYAVRRKQLGKIEWLLAQLVLPLCILVSFVSPFLLEMEIGQRLNTLLQARPAFSHYYLTNQPITLFGTRMIDIPNFWTIMDNGYVYIFMTFGIVVFVLFCSGYAGTVFRYGNRGKRGQEPYGNRELAVIFSYMVYGVMEQFISNAFMNLSLFFLGECMFCVLQAGRPLHLQQRGIPALLTAWGNGEISSRRVDVIHHEVKKAKQVIRKKKKAEMAAGLATGILVLAVFALNGEKAEYVTVPITTVNSIDARSVMFQTDRVYDDKSSLETVMDKYNAIAITDEILQTAIDKATLAYDEVKQLTPEKIRDIMEFSLSLHVQESKIYDSFRLRLLESYHDIPEGAYAVILEEIAVELQDSGDASITVGQIYEENIGKSFGNERIEHIRDREKYFVEKAGNTVRIENIRTGITRILLGCVFGLVIACMIGLICDIIRKDSKG